MPNDATFFVVLDAQNLSPILLPFYLWKPNNRPNPIVEVTELPDYTMVFDASKSTDTDNDYIEFLWNVEGVTGEIEGSRITHRFTSAGEKTVWLTLTDNSGQVGCATRVPVTFVINTLPIPDAGKDKILAPNEIAVFHASNSSDSDGEIIFYQWDFGDGTRAEGKTAKHAYASPGKYRVTILVKDDSPGPNPFSRDYMDVWVNASPIVEIGPNLITTIDELVQLSAANYRDSDGKINIFHWTFGDGDEAERMHVSHSYDKSGFYRVIVKLTDNALVKNRYCWDTLHVFVNEPPVADANREWRVATDEVITFDGSKTRDLDGKLIDYYWDFGDGTANHGMKVANPYRLPGTYCVILKVQDDSRSTTDTDIDSAFVIINHPPVPVAGQDQW